jgi:putative transposase
MAAIAAGASIRRYGSTFEPLPPPERTRSVSKSAISRRFVALSQEQLLQWLSRSLEKLDLPVGMIDGIHFSDRVLPHVILLPAASRTMLPVTSPMSG